MAIGFVGQTNIASGGATDPMSAPALPASTADGNLVLLFVIVKYGSGAGGVTINTPTDWTLLNNGEAANSGLTNSGNDAGNIRAAIFWRIKDAGWSTMPAVDLSGLPNCTMVGAISYSLGGGETWDTPEGAIAVDDSVGSTGIDPAASGTTLALASGDWFGSFAAINGDAGTLGTHTATVSGVTFGTQNTRLNGTTSSGSDLRGHSVDKSYSSGTAGAGPDGALSLTTGSASGAGVMVFYRLRLGGGDANADPAVIPTTVALPSATVTASADVSPAVTPTTVALPSATVTADADVSPSTIPTTVALPAATVTADVSVTPATIDAVVALPAVTVQADADVTPATIATVTALPAPTVTADADVSPGTIATVTALPTPIVTDSGSGDASISPATIATVTTLPPATVTADADVSPSTISTTASLPAATVTASASVSPSTIAAVVALPAVTATGDAPTGSDLHVGAGDVAAVFVGADPADAVFLGSDRVFPAA